MDLKRNQKHIEIVENRKELVDDFIRLNEQWISSYFVLENVDRRLAANPFSIVEGGGYIFSLLIEGRVIGVCALFNEGDGIYELARMAIDPKFRGCGYGSALMSACLAKLEKIDAKRVYLVSNTILQAAINLYKKYGFKVVAEGQHPVYKRANIVMERLITSQIND